MFSKQEVRRMVDSLIKSTGKTQEEIAIDMGYGKNYISDVLSPSGKVTQKFINALQHYGSENTKPAPVVSGDMKGLFQDISERIIRLESHVEVYESAIAGLLTREPGDFVKKVEELRDAVQSATKRRLNELGKK